MIGVIKQVIHDCATGIDGVTYDPARIYGGLAVIVYLANSIYAVSKGQPWGAVDFGTGFGLLMTGIGAAIALKSNTEPKGDGN